MATIFDLVTSQALVSFWETLSNNRAPYMGEELWPEQQKLGLTLKWIKGSAGLPVVLLPSAYDVVSKKRNRIGFEKLSADMPFFKEILSIDEETRQELNIVMETGNSALIDAVIKKVFADNVALLEGARAQRERMRMQALTTGSIAISANGQDYDYDYQMPSGHKVTAAVSWAVVTTDIIAEIRKYMDTVEEDTGVRPERAVCSRKTFGYITKNTGVRNAIWGNNSAAPVSDEKVFAYLMTELKLEVAVYSKKYVAETGTKTAFVPDDVFTLFPAGDLGTGWFGTTPEQSDLMKSKLASVVITDVGVAVTTTETTDPVSVDTKVSMVYLPSFETADQVCIIDVIP